MNEEPSILSIDPDQLTDLTAAKGQVAQLLTMLATLQSLLRSLQQTVDALRKDNDELRRALYGQSRERVVPVEQEIRRKKKAEQSEEEREAARQKALQKRRDNAERRREQTACVEVDHSIEETRCPGCGADVEAAHRLANETSEELEFIPARLVRRRHRRQRRVCSCGCFLIAPPPPRVVEGGQYGPGLHAHVVVSKCVDSLPLERQAKRFACGGVHLSPSTLGDLFHRSADLLRPLYERMVEVVAQSPYVNGDETPLAVQARDKCRKGYMWVFIAPEPGLVTYAFSPSRSGQTPVRILGQSQGVLQVDGYTGYNQVTTPTGRVRAGCLAHGRRKFFAALGQSPAEADEALRMFRRLYEAEYAAAEQGILGTAAHGILRRTQSGALLEELHAWLLDQQPHHLPKGAIGYMLNNWEAMTRFLDDPKIALDNNISERQLRLIALGRKNFLFVGNDGAGQNLAILQSLVSSCQANGVNPQDYLTAVLLRIGDHPQAQIDDLLPHNWRPPPA